MHSYAKVAEYWPLILPAIAALEAPAQLAMHAQLVPLMHLVIGNHSQSPLYDTIDQAIRKLAPPLPSMCV